MTRSPHTEEHDLFVALERVKDGAPTYAYALIKKSYRITEGGLQLCTARALRNDPYDPACDPPIPKASDFWWQKRRTDVVVEGSAWAPGGTPVETSEVRCSVASFTKRIAVFGKRVIEHTAGGRAYIGPPEPFMSVSLDDEHAYGGVDPRIPIMTPRTFQDLLLIAADHPGQYPRNPVGTGYLALEGRVDDFELPNLEDPDDLLDDSRLRAKGPAHWYHQPLPWTLGWQHAMSFTRLAHLGTDAHFPASDPVDLAEVKRGFLPADYRVRGTQESSFHVGFYQEASLGMSFEPLVEGTPISVSGAHPEHTKLSFAVPPLPRLDIEVEGQSECVDPLLTAVVIEPDALLVSFVYCGRTASLPRIFIPKIHPVIPLSARADDGETLHYEAPPIVTLPPIVT